MTVPLAHDAAVPGRDALLDEATVARRLSADRCVRVRATYGFGRRLRALHRVESAGVGSLVAGVTPARAGGRHDAELDASWWVYPNDRKLRALPALAAPAPELVLELLLQMPVSSSPGQHTPAPLPASWQSKPLGHAFALGSQASTQ